MSFIARTGDPNKDNINPDELGRLDISRSDRDAIDDLFDFFARYVRKVHSDDIIHKTLQTNRGISFIDIIGPNDIAYVIAAFK